MDESYKIVLEECFEGMPRFDDGRIDFTDAEVLPVINALVSFDDKVLIMKRTGKVSTNKNTWDCIGGYLDEMISPDKKALKELKEETGIKHSSVEKIISGRPFPISERTRMGRNRRWIIFPSVIVLKHLPDIKLDWEHSEYKWIKSNRIEGFKMAKKIRDVLYACTVADDSLAA